MQRVVTYLIFRESVGLKEIGTPSRLSPPYQQRIGKVGELGHQHADQGADHDEHGAEAQDDHGPVGDQGRVAAARSTGVAGKAAERRRRGVCCPGKPSVLPLPDEESPPPPFSSFTQIIISFNSHNFWDESEAGGSNHLFRVTKLAQPCNK